MIDLTKNISCSECDRGWENFQNLTTEEIKFVNENKFQADFKPGEIIFKQGSPTSNAVFLVHGMAKIYIEGYDNKRMMVGIAKPMQLIAGPGTFVDQRHHYSVAALTDVCACFIKMDVLKELIHQNSKFAVGWLQDISQKALGTFYKFLSHTQKKMHGRLAETLIYLADEIHKSDNFTMVLSRQELGELSGMAKESVVRILKEFSEDKIIDDKCPNIKIINKDKLILIAKMG
ncbi:MAG: Crp/Fnr family transcriptional regulator [Bacteroidales bacterium]|jgi:CRP-like cAMP-binding protein|nr:Crp/Fnr family transcriptional regulator [Bacteroidales bacterium]